MRAIEIGLGVLIMVAAVALAAGVADSLLPLPPLGFGGTLTLIAMGAGLVSHGLIGHRVRQDVVNTAPLRVLGRTVSTLILTVMIVVAVPSLVAPLNLTQVAGFPLGFYVAAQGALLALAILAFRAAQQLDASEAEVIEHTGLPPTRREEH